MFDGSPEAELARIRELIDDGCYTISEQHLVQQITARSITEHQLKTAITTGKYFEHQPNGRLTVDAMVVRGTKVEPLRVVVVRDQYRRGKRKVEIVVFISAMWRNEGWKGWKS